METLIWRQRLLLGLLFGLVALSLLAPLASNNFLPAAADYVFHTSGIVEAKMALEEGQFPIRVLPFQKQGMHQLPFFQFYSPFPYTVAGIILMIAPHNPYLVYKITVWLALFLAAIYFYRLLLSLTASRPAAILSAITYLCAPYFLININTRAAYTEVIAQGLIPIVLYYSWKSYQESFRLSVGIITAFVWFALITTHLITFVYTSLFVGLLFLILTFRNFSAWKGLVNIGLIYCFACLLSVWYLVPIGLVTKNLVIFDTSLGSPIGNNWLTPLATLLSVTAVSPIPTDNGLLNIPLYAAVGWPILFGVGFACFVLSQKDSSTKSNKLILPLVLIFLLAFFMTWSPVDFWRYLPKFLTIAQYSYRLLSQTMWIGVLLLGFALVEMFKDKMDARHVFFGLLLIGLASSSWLPSNKGTGVGIREMKLHPDVGYAQDMYLFKPSNLKEIDQSKLEIIPVTKVQQNCVQQDSVTNCRISNLSHARIVQLPVYYYPELLEIKVNGERVAYTGLVNKNRVLTGVKLQPGSYLISAKFTGIVWANWVSCVAWLILLSGVGVVLVLCFHVAFRHLLGCEVNKLFLS